MHSPRSPSTGHRPTRFKIVEPQTRQGRESLAELLARRSVILDGGLSTQLEAQGVSFDSPLWTGQALLDNPDSIQRAHRAFVDAGADLVISASYQISRVGFVALGRTADEADQALRASVDVAFRAVEGTDALVAASVGPFGAIRHDGSEYRGNYVLSSEELETFHRERLVVLAQAHPDVFAIETIPDLLEVEAVVAALEGTPVIPAWLSVTVAADGRLPAGQTLTEVASLLDGNPRIVALGVNCLDPDLVEAAVTELHAASNLPIIAYANGGGTWSAESGTWSNPHRTASAEQLQRWAAAGARGIGGCCGIDAASLATMVTALEG